MDALGEISSGNVTPGGSRPYCSSAVDDPFAHLSDPPTRKRARFGIMFRSERRYLHETLGDSFGAVDWKSGIWF